MKIGVLALQGAFAEHEKALDKLGVEYVEIREKCHFDGSLDGIIIPGGESTTQGKLLREVELFEPLFKAINAGLPVFGTCAGLILLAKKLSNDENVYFGVLNVSVKRNAYGRQLGSFKTELSFNGIGNVPAVFIRAPYVEEAGEGVEILAEADGKIVAVRQNNILATAFHPELTEDLRIHEYFVDMIKSRIKEL